MISRALRACKNIKHAKHLGNTEVSAITCCALVNPCLGRRPCRVTTRRVQFAPHINAYNQPPKSREEAIIYGIVAED